MVTNNAINVAIRFLPLSVLFWLFGFIAQRFSAESDLLKAPLWLCYLCGVSKNRGIATWPGIIQLLSLSWPILSFLLVIFVPSRLFGFVMGITIFFCVTVALILLRKLRHFQ